VNQRTNPLPYIIAAAGGGLLFLVLFFNWASNGPFSASGWEIFSFVDIVLAVIGAAAAAYSIATIAGSAPSFPWLRPSFLKWLGVISLTIVLTYVFEADNLAFGAFLGIVAALAILAGGILVERPDLAARVEAAAESLGSQPGAQRGAPPPPAAPPGGSESPTTRVQAPQATPAAPSAPQPAASPSPAPAREGGGPPPGWYPDPQGEARLRYWDGSGWTGQTSA
jgi:Protein of unknown function (DUF2510)